MYRHCGRAEGEWTSDQDATVFLTQTWIKEYSCGPGVSIQVLSTADQAGSVLSCCNPKPNNSNKMVFVVCPQAGNRFRPSGPG